MNSLSFSIFIQWIPGRSTILDNKLADKTVKEATTIATNTIFPISFSSSIQVINKTIRNNLPTHERVAQVYQHKKTSQDSKQIKYRKDDVLLGRLRSGHHPSLHHYLHPLDPTQDPICLSCHLDEEDLNHCLWECPAGVAIRQQVFGNHKGFLK